MPLDGSSWSEVTPTRVLPDKGLEEAIWLLKRARDRVTRRYCWSAFYTPPSWWNASPGFCMQGALSHSDAGHWEDSRWIVRSLAEKFIQDQIHDRTLIDFGSRGFMRGRVLRVLNRAIKVAEAENISSKHELIE